MLSVEMRRISNRLAKDNPHSLCIRALGYFLLGNFDKVRPLLDDGIDLVKADSGSKDEMDIRAIEKAMKLIQQEKIPEEMREKYDQDA